MHHSGRRRLCLFFCIDLNPAITDSRIIPRACSELFRRISDTQIRLAGLVRRHIESQRRFTTKGGPGAVESPRTIGNHETEQENQDRTRGGSNASIAVCVRSGSAAWPWDRLWTEKQSKSGHTKADTARTPLWLAERET